MTAQYGETAISATISIYQNPDHVAGLLQQMYVAPLVTSESHEQGEDRTSAEKDGGVKRGGLKGAGSVPFLGSIEADLGGERTRLAESGAAANTRLTRNYEYSQAYYLYILRNALLERQLLKTVSSSADAQGLRSGDFVEYQATFRPNELNALLDILTPDLIAAITHHQVRQEGIRLFSAYEGDHEGLKVFAEQNLAKAQANSDIAKAIALAVKADFRAEKTREFYGSIGDGDEEVTAITICDNPHFVVDDEDRILDGQFTVLGKVTSPITSDLPILARNKLLDRVNPEAVDALFDQIRDSVTDQARGIEARVGHQDDDEDSAFDEVVDMALASRIAGQSFKVIPIAIYA